MPPYLRPNGWTSSFWVKDPRAPRGRRQVRWQLEARTQREAEAAERALRTRVEADIAAETLRIASFIASETARDSAAGAAAAYGDSAADGRPDTTGLGAGVDSVQPDSM